MRLLPASLRRLPLLGAAAAGLLCLAPATTAEAALTQFASFNLQGSTSSPFVFTYTAPGGATFNASTAVTFNFLNVPGAPSGDIAATLTLTSSATNTAGGQGAQIGSNVFQPLDAATNTMEIRRTSDNVLLLRMAFTGTISGTSGSATAGLNSDTATGDTVTFTSAFLDFTGTTQRTSQIALAQVSPVLTFNNVTKYLNDFTSTAQGGFSSDGPPRFVPEPGSWVLMGGGLAVAGLAGYRRRRATRA